MFRLVKTVELSLEFHTAVLAICFSMFIKRAKVYVLSLKLSRVIILVTGHIWVERAGKSTNEYYGQLGSLRR